MDDRFNTAAGWVLGAGIIALGASIVSGMYFKADKHAHVEEPGFFIQGEAAEGGEAAGPDLGTLLASADPAAGEKVFAKCSACHTINQGGANGIGPNLWAIVGKPVGKHAAGFAYSSALSGHGGDWTYENLDHWLTSPRAFADGTKMSFAGLGKAEDRANLLAYLKANGGGPDFPAPAAPAAAEEAAPSEAGEAPSEAEAAGAMGADEPVAEAGAATAN
ncbi:cytochrome c family protein [Qipengyuania sp. RANM35]|uniref:c-type cytochrome n=1 Tax=Qipengyuania sp. RANM35 TaxID=3068635 RepID=UPI0034DB4103